MGREEVPQAGPVRAALGYSEGPLACRARRYVWPLGGAEGFVAANDSDLPCAPLPHKRFAELIRHN